MMHCKIPALRLGPVAVAVPRSVAESHSRRSRDNEPDGRRYGSLLAHRGFDAGQGGKGDTFISLWLVKRKVSVMNTKQLQGISAEGSKHLRTIDSITWAVLFVWVGVAMLTALPWGWFLFGVGVLVICGQIARWQMDLRVDYFGVACGIVLLAGGAWARLALPLPLVPTLLILLGLVLFGKAVVGVTR